MRRSLAILAVLLVAAAASAGRVDIKGSGGSGTGDGSVLEAAAPPATPASGFAKLWRDTVSGLLHWIDDLGGEHVLLEREEDPFSANSCLRGKNNRAEEAPGCTMDDEGVLGVQGLTVAGAGPVPKNVFSHANNAVVSTTFGCMPWDGSRVWTGMTGGSLLALNQAAMEVNQDNALTFRSLTVMFGDAAAVTNYVAGEKLSVELWACVLDGTPTNADCTCVDKVMLQHSATPGTYGVAARTGEVCQGIPCVASIPIDGGGCEGSTGTTSFAAGSMDYFMVCAETDDVEWTAEGDGDGGGADTADPADGSRTFDIQASVSFTN
jgi:hypothetical protein